MATGHEWVATSLSARRPGNLAPRKVPGPGEQLGRIVDKAIRVNERVVDEYLDQVRRRQPDASPSETLHGLNRQYLTAITVSGATAGATAAAPGIGLATGIAANVVETGVFLEFSVLYVLSVARFHGVAVQDLDRRRALLLAVLLGDTGAATVQKMAGRTGAHWGKNLVSAVPMSKITAINRVLGRYFITKYGTKQGIIVLGRLAPFGIGAAIGGVANAALGKGVITATAKSFGPPPEGSLMPIEPQPHSPDAAGATA